MSRDTNSAPLIEDFPLSVEVSLALDLLGYRPAMIRWRRYCYGQYSDLVYKWMAKAPPSLCGFSLRPYLTGSKVEGTTVLYLSDEDYMMVVDSFICAQDPRGTLQESDKLGIKMIPEHSDPGYVLLQRSWVKNSSCKTVLQRFLERFIAPHLDGGEYVCSENINKAILDAYNHLYRTALGDRSVTSELASYIEAKPAEMDEESRNFKLKIRNLRFTLDVVLAFPCHIQELLLEWASRKRKYGWPTKDKIHKITRMCAYLDPKSSKQSDKKHLEFRICHTFGEIELMKSLNETQIKLYILLKELFKSELDPKLPDIITSYVLKNVVFWMCESSPQNHFEIDLLLQRLTEALRYLYQHVVDEVFIPNYFIPKRNLLDRKITLENMVTIGTLLSSLIEDDANVVFRINKVDRGIVSVRKDICIAILTCHFRDLVEIYFLNKRKIDLGDCAKAAILYLSKAAYDYLQKFYFHPNY